ncbi:hypothetical protein DN752_12045 [Echinicola strongylocentroti]|uniref:Membrane or secreted protein n=1 Tax=Echinicola strongylocentroti TaxID=1795355 RepID=A0A2Z4IJB3_9BACT|nr:hypothetical protein [Echinicola strongylocentroti]AWW30797.1 hypothetical protein DN752_12045 [Echinicola strongylocentroti]
MKKLFLFPFLLLVVNVFAQDLDGAWKLTHLNGDQVTEEEWVKIYQDGYFAFGAKTADTTHHFIGAGGGVYEKDGENGYSETFDFHTKDPEKIGTTTAYNMDFVGEKMVLTYNQKGSNVIEIWEKISDRDDDLNGTWVITGRKRDGELRTMTPGARRTVKILGGGRFQWIAFNSETKEFSGTGGGNYTAQNGKYTEYIEFFSRDDSRVGASLGFDYEVKDGEWHHSGLSSKGDPIYEIWSNYRDAYLEQNEDIKDQK